MSQHDVDLIFNLILAVIGHGKKLVIEVHMRLTPY